jgi:hypothetical protein
MKTIQERFKRWGGDWQLLERDGDIALFLQDGRNFNVAIIQHSESREIAGKMTEGGEYLPSEKQYGRLAWNYGTSERRAREKFAALIHERENPTPKKAT